MDISDTYRHICGAQERKSAQRMGTQGPIVDDKVAHSVYL